MPDQPPDPPDPPDPPKPRSLAYEIAYEVAASAETAYYIRAMDARRPGGSEARRRYLRWLEDRIHTIIELRGALPGGQVAESVADSPFSAAAAWALDMMDGSAPLGVVPDEIRADPLYSYAADAYHAAALALSRQLRWERGLQWWRSADAPDPPAHVLPGSLGEADAGEVLLDASDPALEVEGADDGGN